MTAITLTHGQGYLSDMDSASYWGAKTDSADPLTGVSITCNDGDVIEIEGTCDAAANEYVYYAYDMTNISSDTYGYITIRYRTSESSNGLAVKVKLVFTAGTQTVLDAAYSTTWKEITVAITAAKTIDKVEIWADDTDAVAAGTFQVEYDFIMIHTGTFTFPAVSEVSAYTLSSRDVDIHIPGRDGAVTQYLGLESDRFAITGVMKNWDTWGSGSGASQTFGEYLTDVQQNRADEPFHWLTSDDFTGKVTMRTLDIRKVAGNKSARAFTVEFTRYSLSPYNAASWV